MNESGNAVTIEHDVGGLGVHRVLINRPPANAFDLGLYRTLTTALLSITRGGTFCSSVQIGSKLPRFFSAGRDIKEPEATSAAGLEGRRQTVLSLFEAISEMPCPTLAVVDGYALGVGAVIASLCDIRLASPSSKFGIPEVAAGSIGGARQLMRLLPLGVVRRMALTGLPIDASEASRLGFAELVPDGTDLWAEANRLSEVISKLDRGNVERVKAALNAVEPLSLAEGVGVEMRWSGGDHA